MIDEGLSGVKYAVCRVVRYHWFYKYLIFNKYIALGSLVSYVGLFKGSFT